MRPVDSFRAARLVRLVNLFLQALLFLTLFAGLNYVALNHAWRFDLSQGRRFQLSAETKAYLAGLKEPVRVVVSLAADANNDDVAQAKRDLTALLREYTYETNRHSPNRIVVEHLNIYQRSARAAELGIEEPNAVVLLSGPRRHAMALGEFYRIRQGRRDEFIGEAALTSGLLTVSNPVKKKIYFVGGHQEMLPDEVDPVRGLSQFRDELRVRNFEIARLELSVNQQVPDDASLLIIAAPQGRFSKYEEDLLRSYMQTRAGRVIIMLEPGRPHGLENLFFEWSILVYDNLLIDFDNLTKEGNLLLGAYLDDPLTANLRKTDTKLQVGSCRVVDREPGRRDDEGLSVKTLVAAGRNAWGETNYRNLQEAPKFDEGLDMRGRPGNPHLGVVTISERLKPANLPLSVRGGRLAVIGTGDLVANNRVSNPGNFQFMLNLVRWATDSETEVNIPARTIPRYQLTLTEKELGRLQLGLFLVVPGLTALLGLIVYWTRRS